MSLDVVVANGLVSTSVLEREPLDIGIAGGAIVSLQSRVEAEGAFVIDVEGKDVFPGFIDPHTHMELPVSGTVSSDDFYTGTVAAACGGVTTILDFAGAVKGQSLIEALVIWHERARAKAVIDYGFHMIVPQLEEWQLDEFPALVAEGVSTVKCMMAYKRGPQGSDDGNLLRVIWKARESGALPMVHAENGDAIDATVDKFMAEERKAPEWHPRSRPAILEAEAVNRAATLAALGESPVYVVHLSSGAGLDAVLQARRRGWQVMTETCPQYLTLTEEEYLRPGFEAAKFVCSPPLRTGLDRVRMWGGLESGVIQLVASDHCPFFFHGQKDRGRDSFALIPNGIPTIQAMFSLVFSQGVNGGRLTRRRFVELSATHAAKIFGMFPRKGTIEVGSDADLVIYDATRTVTLSRQPIDAPTLESDAVAPLREHVDYTPYEGQTVTGWPDTVLSRGEVIVSAGNPVSDIRPGRGRFISRSGGQWTGWGSA
jgi:dihydropyrimidinase